MATEYADDFPCDRLPVDTRTKNGLKNWGLLTVGQVRQSNELSQVYNLGPKSLKKLKAILGMPVKISVEDYADAVREHAEMIERFERAGVSTARDADLDKHAAVIALRLSGLSIVKIAKQVGLSAARVQQLVDIAIRRLGHADKLQAEA